MLSSNNGLLNGIIQHNETCPRVTNSGSNLHLPSHSINLFLSTKSVSPQFNSLELDGQCHIDHDTYIPPPET